jgi:hypothetical protein
MSERWMSLSFMGFSRYEVSSLSRITNVNTGYMLKGSKTPEGYWRVYMVNDTGKQQSKSFHVLTASAFLGIDKTKTVDHIDQDKNNNDLENLRWATKSEQSLNRKKYLCRGRSIVQMDKDGKFIRIWDKMKDAAQALGVSQCCLTEVCRGTQKTSAGYKWKYNIDYIEGEEWRALKLKDHDLVHVSSEGRVMSMHGRILVGARQGNYLVAGVYNYSECRNILYRIQRLVAFAFYGYDKRQVNHLDGDPHNNRAYNLAYATGKENVQHAIATGLRKFDTFNGYKRRIGRYNDNYELVQEYESIMDASRDTGISHTSLARAAKCIRWKEAGSHWQML